jgi:septin family protein
MKNNRIEEELDAIRIKLYEEMKDLTPEEHTKKTNERLQKLAEQYGFTIVSSARRNVEKKEVS